MFKSIYIEITNSCNLSCSFCKGTTREKEFMSADDFKQVLEKIKNHTKYIQLHVLGEPLMHPHLDDILYQASNYEMKVNITTNGRLLNKKITTIKKHKCIRQVNISLHSFENEEEIKELLKVIDNINEDCYISFRLWNLGVDNSNDMIIDCLNEHYQTNIIMDSKSFKLKNNTYLNFEQQFKWPDINDEEYRSVGSCYGLRTHIGILVDGTVVPCCLDTDGIINLGNIFKQNLDDILKSERCQKMKESLLNKRLVEPLCKKCHYITRFDKREK